jgi:hypothetical protein
MALVAVAFWRGNGRDPIRFSAAAILAFVIGGKVLSPQYLIWLVPFATAIGGRAGRVARPLFLVACLLTGLLYPWATGSLRSLQTWAFLVLNIRNVALLGVWVIWLRIPSDESATSPAISGVLSVP